MQLNVITTANRHAVLFFLFAAGLICINSTALSDSDEGTGEIHGLVFDRQSNAPLQGIRISFQNDVIAQSNEDGAFQFEIKKGEYEFNIEGEGYPRVSTRKIPVTTGTVTEVIISISPDGSPPDVDMESAGAVSTAEAELSDVPSGKIRGRVIHVETGDSVQDARIFVRGMQIEGRTDREGWFELELPEGTHDISAVHPDFGTMTLNGVAVRSNETSEVRMEAVPVGVELDEFTITAPRIEGSTVDMLQERREAGSVNDVIGAEQMSKAGDSDAAGALKRVTGVTVVGGKYVYVRGLGERYSSTLLNGSSLPSPEPERRVVPLDLFPTGVLDSVVIQKTYTPDMPGEFGGGAVMLRTRGYPSEFLLDINVSSGIHTGTTFTEGLMVDKGGKYDMWGIDDGSRRMPGVVKDASKDQQILEGDMFSERGYKRDELEKFGEAMPNNWGTSRHMIPPNWGGSVTIGDSFDLFGTTLGSMAALVYDNDWSNTEKNFKVLNIGAGDETEVFHEYGFDETNNNVKLAGIGTLGFELDKNNKITSTTLVNRITDNEVRYYTGYNRDVASDIRVTRITWIERMLVTEQVAGHHVIEPAMNFEVDWRYTYSRATRDEPDRREVTYYREGDTSLWRLSNRADNNHMLFSELLDNNHDVGFDFGLPFEQWFGEEAKAKAGTNIVLKDRGVDTRRYKYQNRPTDVPVSSLPPDEMFTPQYIGHDGTLIFQEITRQTDNYSADQQIYAGYAMIDIPIGWGLRLVGGLRTENSVQNVKTFELFNPDSKPVEANLDTIDYLPAVNLSYEFYTDMLVRAGFSQTVSRPDFRELSPAVYTGVIGGRDIFGNPELDRATISNVDLRWEWYPSEGESISFGGFYKNFEKPIELIIVLGAQHAETFENAKAANNYGLELDARKNFDFVSERARDFFIAGNVTWIYSRIELPEKGGQTSSNRPLQGQSPFIINTQFGYDNVDMGTTAVLLYNVFGERISTVGAVGIPDVYEQPFHQFDFVFKQKLGYGFKLGFKAKNILNGMVEFTQGDEAVESYRKGSEYSLSLGYSY